MPRKPGLPQTSLSVHLVKQTVSAHAALKDVSALSAYPVKDGSKKIGDLYVAPVASNPPRWRRYVLPYVAGLPNLTNRVVSAVMLVAAGGRTFALTFGYGGRLLVPEALEDGFGLRVTLNLVPEGSIRTISKKSLDAFAHHTLTQAMRSGRLRQFGVDLEQDLLQAVTGTPADAGLGKRLVGRDSLGVLTRAAMPELPALLERYLAEFQSTAYQITYPDFGQMAEEQSPAVLAELEAELLRKIANRDLDRLWLAVPEIIDWNAIEGFRYREDGDELYDDLHITEFLGHLRDPSKLTLDRLRFRRAFAIDGSVGRATHDWSVFRCLHCEIEKQGDTFVLSGGKWFRLKRDFVATVDKFVAPLLAPHSLPAATSKEDEAEYNKRAAKGLPGCVVMDRANVRHGGGQSQIEFCDLFTNDRKMIHVKKYAGSGVLSHLFAQGANAAEMLLFDADFREKVRKRLPTTHRDLVGPSAPKTGDYEVIYGIIGRPMGTKSLGEALPFFSRVTLRRVAQRLQGAGYRVSVAWIPNR